MKRHHLRKELKDKREKIQPHHREQQRQSVINGNVSLCLKIRWEPGVARTK